MADALRAFLERIAPHADLERPDLTAVGEALVAFAADHDYLRPLIARLGDTSGLLPLFMPGHGPRLSLVHRREAQMSAVHDHGVWVVVAPVVGLESHRRWRRTPDSDGERVEIVETQALEAPSFATLMPPDDIHDHGHLAGVGRPGYVLILLGDDQFARRRREWDPATGRSRELVPGDRGRWLASEPVPLPAPA